MKKKTKPKNQQESKPEYRTALVRGHIPDTDEIKFTLGNYYAFSTVGKGGMGEVFLAFDSVCGRRIALKKIRDDLVDLKNIHDRFLKEARVTCQLTHPAIIPIYAIHEDNKNVYYTMPYVEGETLKEILRKTRLQEKQGEKLDYLGGSIPALMRIFLTVCQAVAYAHSKGILHRDLKPENIIIGNYGEVLILDWGLAKLLHDEEEEISYQSSEHQPHLFHELTHLGKVVGTLSYMAPERSLGNPATPQTDVYSLGVILYQLLTLHKPFKRAGLKEFRSNWQKEVLEDPSEVAPYRDVPPILSRVAEKCLDKSPEKRYRTVQELIHDLENYLEGRAEWFEMGKLDIHDKACWEFQEHIFIAEHVAISRDIGTSEWVNMMVSKESFAQNTRIDADVVIGEKGKGIGLLMCIPEHLERSNINEGYCLWIDSDQKKGTLLFRSSVAVMHAPDTYLKKGIRYHISLEKSENNIHFYLNGVLQGSYIGHLPMFGTHIGILSRDDDFTIENLTVSVGSLSVMVNCLAVPDAFLANKDYETALSEYRRIGYSFPGRAEGREAMFRAGITLMEQANTAEKEETKEHLFDQALEEFEKLHATPGAPLEYLGKSLVYQELKEYSEEVKCFELAFRRYPRHPLLHILEEHLVYRMHEMARTHRKAAYELILTGVRHVPESVLSQQTNQKLLQSLKNNWEPLDFIIEDPLNVENPSMKFKEYEIVLSFWLNKVYILAELIDLFSNMKTYPLVSISNALFSMIEMGGWMVAEKKFAEIKNRRKKREQDETEVYDLLQIAIHSNKTTFSTGMETLYKKIETTVTSQQERVLVYLLQQLLKQDYTSLVHQVIDKVRQCELPYRGKLRLDALQIWAHLLDHNWGDAGRILLQYPLEYLSKEKNPLFPLYGCFLNATEGIDIAMVHFTGVFEVPFPATNSLLGHYITGKISERQGWFKKAFSWEKRHLFQQLALFFHCGGDEEKAALYSKLEAQELHQER